MARAILYNKRKPLVELEIERTKVTQIYRVLDEVCLPIVLQDRLTTNTINDWLSKRIIPEKRDGMTEIRSRFSGFANFNNMFSYQISTGFSLMRVRPGINLISLQIPMQKTLEKCFSHHGK